MGPLLFPFAVWLNSGPPALGLFWGGSRAPPIPPDLRDLPDLQGCRKKIPGLQDLLGPKDLQDQQAPPDLQAHRVPWGPKVQQDHRELKVTRALRVQPDHREQNVTPALRVQPNHKERKVTPAL